MTLRAVVAAAFFLLPLSTAQEYTALKCPKIEPVKSVDEGKLSTGFWYEVARLRLSGYSNLYPKCSKTRFSPDLKMETTFVARNESELVLHGRLKRTGEGGHFNVTYDNIVEGDTEGAVEHIYNILLLEYDDFAFVYGCQHVNKMLNPVTATILSRTVQLSRNAEAKIKKVTAEFDSALPSLSYLNMTMCTDSAANELTTIRDDAPATYPFPTRPPTESQTETSQNPGGSSYDPPATYPFPTRPSTESDKQTESSKNPGEPTPTRPSTESDKQTESSQNPGVPTTGKPQDGHDGMSTPAGPGVPLPSALPGLSGSPDTLPPSGGSNGEWIRAMLAAQWNMLLALGLMIVSASVTTMIIYRLLLPRWKPRRMYEDDTLVNEAPPAYHTKGDKGYHDNPALEV